MPVRYMLSSHLSWSLSAQRNDMPLKAASGDLRAFRVNIARLLNMTSFDVAKRLGFGSSLSESSEAKFGT